MLELNNEEQKVLKELYKLFENNSEISVSSPDYKKTLMDYFEKQQLIEVIDASTFDGWNYIIKPTYYGERTILKEDRKNDIDNLTTSSENNDNNMINVFISYCWEDEEHKNWVRSLADSLLNEGINAVLDQYDLSLGERLPQFMEQSITNSDYVLIICTPNYKIKADERKGGVGYEGHIISGELFAKGDDKKFIPIIRKGTVNDSMPVFLQSKLAVDLSNEKYYSENYNDLITTLHGIKKKPIVKKTYFTNSYQITKNKEKENEPVHISGIIIDQVTIPKMDGSRGSALYQIPFKLSKSPSSLWKQIFIKTWNFPPKFTTMHRPNIASVIGDKIILDGTSIEEVRDYHRETLTMCVNIANKEEARIVEEENIRLKKEQELKNAHYSNVEKIANDIKF